MFAVACGARGTSETGEEEDQEDKAVFAAVERYSEFIRTRELKGY